MRAGDFIFKPSGTQWVVVFVLDAKGIDGLKDGKYVFAVRPVGTPYGDDIIYHLFPAATLGWASKSVFETGDIYTVAGEDFAINRQRGMFVQLRREDGSTEWACRWRLAFNMMRGADVPLSAEWREATDGEI
ncbi:hypothetical protein EOA32_36845 [Mesorhizobium sp. M1A.F.Ca.ET.072.01.1.1]|uniref:hypothetical protein n=1 Tax=Mesorhizobium sp. M1A.F.Ca.ET.072.01.1.1 TaxID=2496753 RepID=UPI000FD53ACF|nr:hypothetical protein [Mesorhizobium sp. M1A.F.Ca.ET.072.01.1.1]RUW44355.1 hypothetical protein EOA32_36845 [Mesorhizobium sp. M1A.F.Ca.ET.072.01.1.1]TIV03054.1 MAG: hypothetical protein E5W04_10315 [Mesorhizobium sp.]